MIETLNSTSMSTITNPHLYELTPPYLPEVCNFTLEYEPYWFNDATANWEPIVADPSQPVTYDPLTQ